MVVVVEDEAGGWISSMTVILDSRECFGRLLRAARNSANSWQW